MRIVSDLTSRIDKLPKAPLGEKSAFVKISTQLLILGYVGSIHEGSREEINKIDLTELPLSVLESTLAWFAEYAVDIMLKRIKSTPTESKKQDVKKLESKDLESKRFDPRLGSKRAEPKKGHISKEVEKKETEKETENLDPEKENRVLAESITSIIVELNGIIREKLEKTSPFEHACAGRIEYLQNLTEAEWQDFFKQTDSEGNTALAIAARKGDSETVNFLLSKKAPVDSKNKRQLTPLYLACETEDISAPLSEGHLQCLQLLVEAKSDVNVICDSMKNNWGGKYWSPIAPALGSRPANRHLLQALNCLIKAGAPLHKPFHKWPPEYKGKSHNYESIHVVQALQLADIDVIFLLLNNGLCPSVPNAAWDSGVDIAAYKYFYYYNKTIRDTADSKDATDSSHILMVLYKTIIELFLEKEAQSCYRAYTPAIISLAGVGDIDLITKLLKTSTEPDMIRRTAKSHNQEMALHQVVYSRNPIATAQCLLQAGAYIDCRDDNYVTPLMKAAKEGTFDLIQFFLDQKANPKCKDKDGLNIFEYLSYNQNLTSQQFKEIVRRLINMGADIDSVDKEGRTLLMRGIVNGRGDVVANLLEFKADLNKADGYGNSCLDIAVLKYSNVSFASDGEAGMYRVEQKDGDVENRILYKHLILFILEHDAKSSQHRMAPLYFLTHLSDLEMMEMLIEKAGCDVNAYANRYDDKYGVEEYTDKRTPLHQAVFSKNPLATVEYLIRKKANVNAQSSKQGCTPLMLAARAGSLELVNLLLAHGADPNLKDDDGKGVLFYAKKNEGRDAGRICDVLQKLVNVEAVEALEATGSIDARDRVRDMVSASVIAGTTTGLGILQQRTESVIPTPPHPDPLPQRSTAPHLENNLTKLFWQH